MAVLSTFIKIYRLCGLCACSAGLCLHQQDQVQYSVMGHCYCFVAAVPCLALLKSSAPDKCQSPICPSYKTAPR